LILYATTIAQNKVDYQVCHLTWAIGSTYRSIHRGNPDGQIWEILTTPVRLIGGAVLVRLAEETWRLRRNFSDPDFNFRLFILWVGSVADAIFTAFILTPIRD